MAHISPEDVRVTARLARLDLSDEEVTRLARDLEKILNYVDELKSLDTTGVEPLTHAVSFDCPLRPDDVVPSLDVDEALANAPRRADRFFQVPRIVPVANENKGEGR